MRTEKMEAPPQAEHVCPACKQPVATVAKKHKTMGVFYPRWVAGPCHNSECAEYIPAWVHPDPHYPYQHPQHPQQPTGQTDQASH
ncbi:phage terminase large subunit family protein [Yinghuangia soli]|uniref:Phage terminase large subunit family protein n=1 Tax=Yinghuangia soli TaxID=2908204 RepID=A0AA41Q378_9ACTN|nr:phage terminase large subunit family protein [Yinghuangia soli]MCF2530486.1 phage terminase large subunit family protein [Yinghuangia soli]